MYSNRFKISSIFLSVILLLSTFSVTISQHYCGSYLVDSSIVKKADSCKMEMTEGSEQSACSKMKKDCCSDLEFSIDGQDELKIVSEEFSHSNQFIASLFLLTYINLFEGLEENEYLNSEYPPPLIVRTIFKLDETYLI